MDPVENDVLIIGTDGLWDVTSNEKAGSIVKTCLDQFSPDDPNRLVHISYLCSYTGYMNTATSFCLNFPWFTLDFVLYVIICKTCIVTYITLRRLLKTI